MTTAYEEVSKAYLLTAPSVEIAFNERDTAHRWADARGIKNYRVTELRIWAERQI